MTPDAKILGMVDDLNRRSCRDVLAQAGMHFEPSDSLFALRVYISKLYRLGAIESELILAAWEDSADA